jgi:Protein of unknown function (DUF2934)
MKSTLDGTKTQSHRSFNGASRLSMPSETGIAATPESIHWTQAAHERSAALRHDRIAIAAYLMAEARGFEPGHDAHDWLRAQSQIDAIDAGEPQRRK